MADEINYDELNRQARDAADSFNRLNRGFGSVDPALGPYSNAQIAAANAITRQNAARKRMMDATKEFVNEFAETSFDLGTSLTRGNTEFSQLSRVAKLTINTIGGLAASILGEVPRVGSILKGIAKKVTEVAADMSEIMIQQFEVGWSSYKDIVDKGVVSSFSDMAELSSSTSVRFEDLNGVLAEYSDTLAKYNSQLSGGGDAFKRLAKGSAEIRESFYTIGIDAKEFSEFQLKFVEEQNRRGFLDRKNEQQLVEGTRAYIIELNTVTKLFGISRKEQQKNRDIAMNENRFRASLVTLSQEIADPKLAEKIGSSALNLSNILQEVAPTIASGVRELFASSGVASGEQSRTLETLTRGEAGKIVASLRRGEIDEYEARNRILKSLEKNQKDTEAIAAYAKDTIVAQATAEVNNLITQGTRTQQEVEKARAAATDTKDEQTESLASAAKDLEISSQKLQGLFTSSKTATWAMNKLSAAARSLAETIREWVDTPTKNQQKPARQPVRPGATVPESGRTKLPQEGSFEDNPEQIIQFIPGELGTGDRKHFDQLAPMFKAQVLDAAAEYFELTGKKMQITSSYRSFDEQKSLYDAWIARGRTGLPAAPPGKGGFHELGRAIDTPQYNDPKLVEQLNHVGLYRPFKNDPVHFQARTGGIFTGTPDASYLVEMHGDEIVTDVVDNKIVPPDFMNSKSRAEVIADIIQMSGNRLSQMIDILTTTTRTQRRIVTEAG